MEAQAWRFKTNGDMLTITGRDGMGIAYGVFTFLEKYADIHWYAPDTEEVPDLSGWRIPNLDESGKPSFSYREMFIGKDFMDGTWRLRNKESNRAAFEVGVRTGSPRDCHTFAYYAKTLKEKRPDLFKGRKSASGGECGELCMTDEATRDLVAEEMCRYIESDAAKCEGKPRYTIPTFYDLSQNDGGSGGECMCPGCKALFEAAGSYSGPNIAFVSAVAERVKRRHPEVTIQTFAYSYTQDPPTNAVVAADNVNVRYSRSWVFDPLLSGAPQGDKLAAWARHARQLGIWSYWRTNRGLLFPFVKKRADIRDELRFCRRLGVTRYFAENEEPLSRSFAMLQHWLFLKMAEDPSQDVFSLSDRFIHGYYGRASAPVRKYLNYLERRQNSGAGCLDNPQRQHLDHEFFEKANAWMDEAERLAAGDEKVLRHIRWERIVIDRAMYENLGVLLKDGYAYDRETTLARFLPNLKDQIKSWCGLQPPSRAALKAQRLLAAEAEAKLYSHYPVPMPVQFSGNEVVVNEWNQIRPASAVVVDDGDAAAGAAFYDPAYKCSLPFSIGYWGYDRGGKSLDFKTQAEIPQDEKFHLYMLGEAVVMSPMYIHYDTWHFRHYMRTIGIVPSKWQIWVSMKFQGPEFVEGSTKESRVLFDRLFYVKGDRSNDVQQ